MTVDTAAFAWLEIPSTALGSSFSNTFTFSFAPLNCPDGDNVTPPRPKNLPNSNPKTVSICTHGGTWQVSGNVGNFKVAGGPYSMMTGNQWDPPEDKATWTGDQDVLIIAIKFKQA
jgi:hypothetical protein